MALSTIRAKGENAVIGIDSSHIIIFMAAKTISYSRRVITALMALDTIINGVAFFQRKESVIYFVGIPIGYGQTMTRCAIG